MTKTGLAPGASPAGAANARKALVILDQVPFSALGSHTDQLKAHKNLGVAELGFIPRTTPVGHATISSGKLPCVHRVQGREWLRKGGSDGVRENIELLQSYPAPQPQVRTILSDDLRLSIANDCIARELRRRAPDSPIVVASGKGFVSYLLGLDHADIMIFPCSILPSLVQGRWRVATAILPQSATARRVLNTTEAQRRIWEMFDLHGSHFPELERVWYSPSGARQALEMHWLLPGAWATTHAGLNPERSVRASWVDYMDERWPAVDDLIQAIALECLYELERAIGASVGTMIQSRFATDTHGHRYGVDHARYKQTLLQALASLDRLVGEQTFSHVAITSDHGGRATPTTIRFNPAKRSTLPPMPLPDVEETETLFKSGDHLVGYSSKWPLQTDVQVWTGETLKSVDLGEDVLTCSFHPEQRPSTLILPTADSRFANESIDGLHFAGGGEHGCGVELTDDGVQIADGRVPFIHLSASEVAVSARIPNRLADVRDWFVAL